MGPRMDVRWVSGCPEAADGECGGMGDGHPPGCAKRSQWDADCRSRRYCQAPQEATDADLWCGPSGVISGTIVVPIELVHNRNMPMQNVRYIAPEAWQRQFSTAVRKNVNAYFKERGLSTKGDHRIVIKTIAMLAMYITPFILMLAMPLVGWWALLM